MEDILKEVYVEVVYKRQENGRVLGVNLINMGSKPCRVGDWTDIKGLEHHCEKVKVDGMAKTENGKIQVLATFTEDRVYIECFREKERLVDSVKEGIEMDCLGSHGREIVEDGDEEEVERVDEMQDEMSRELIEKGHWSQEEVSYFYWEEECEKPKQISTMYALQIAEAGDRFNKLKLYHTKQEAKEGLRDEIAKMVYATAKSLFKSHKFSDKKLKKEIDSLTEEAWENIEFGGVWERISGFAFVFRTLMA